MPNVMPTATTGVMSQARPVVGVAREGTPYIMTMEALAALEETPVAASVKGRKVLLKPHSSRPLDPASGASTHPQVLEAAIDWFVRMGAEAVAVGDSPALGLAGATPFHEDIVEMCERKGTPLFNFDHTERIWLENEEAHAMERVCVTGIIAEYDFIVPVPTMSTSPVSGVALSCNALTGLAWRQHKLPFQLVPLGAEQELAADVTEHGEEAALADEVIAGFGGVCRDLALCDLAGLVYPEMVIIDGSTGMEGDGPHYGKVREAGLVLAGTDALATDKVAATLMDIPPQSVSHLMALEAEKVGAVDEPLVTPVNWETWTTRFALARAADESLPMVTVKDKLGRASKEDDLFLFLDRHYDELKAGEKVCLAYGDEGIFVEQVG